MKTISLHAYWAGNLGDDLMVKILLERYPQYRFYCPKETHYVETFRKYSNFVDKGKLRRKLYVVNAIANAVSFYLRKDFLINRISTRIAGKCCASVRIGGSIFMQSPNEPLYQRIKNEEGMLKSGPLFVIGANFGPYSSEEFRQAFSTFFSKCAGVTFRDRASWALFSNEENIHYAPDVVLNLKGKNVREGKTVIISIIDVRGRSFPEDVKDAYEALILNICRKSIQNGDKPLLMSFCKKEGDENAIERILTQLAAEGIDTVDAFRYNGSNMDEAIELLQTASYIVASRFHAMILALCFEKPFYCLSYSDKIINVLKDIGSDAYISLYDIKDSCTDEVLGSTFNIRGIDDYRTAAEEQFAVFDLYMSGITKGKQRGDK